MCLRNPQRQEWSLWKPLITSLFLAYLRQPKSSVNQLAEVRTEPRKRTLAGAHATKLSTTEDELCLCICTRAIVPLLKNHINQCSEAAPPKQTVGCSSVIYYRAQHAFDVKQVSSLEAATGGAGEGWLGAAGVLTHTNQFLQQPKKCCCWQLRLRTSKLSLKAKCIILISRIKQMLRL